LYNGAYLTEKAVLSNKRNDFQAQEGMMLTLMGKHKQDDSQFLRCFNRLHTSLKSNITMRLQASPTRKPEQLANQFPNTSGIVNNHRR
jgi:ABC-type histidine transport system ATPase subunit